MASVLMASASGAVGSGAFRFAFLLSREVRITVEHHRGLLLDTSLVPPADDASGLIVQLVLDGTFELEKRRASPVAFFVPEAYVEGAAGRRTMTVRACGEPYVAVQLRVDRARQGTVSPGRAPLHLHAPVWAAARALAATAFEAGEARATEAATILIQRLIDSAVLDPRTCLTGNAERRFASLWQSIAPVVERLDLLPTLDQLSQDAGASRRTLIRATQAFIPFFGIRGRSWRAATHRLRLKAALLMLSAEHATVSEVAAAAGYGSVEALARAFRDAGLGSPSGLQLQLRASREALERLSPSI